MGTEGVGTSLESTGVKEPQALVGKEALGLCPLRGQCTSSFQASSIPQWELHVFQKCTDYSTSHNKMESLPIMRRTAMTREHNVGRLSVLTAEKLPLRTQADLGSNPWANHLDPPNPNFLRGRGKETMKAKHLAEHSAFSGCQPPSSSPLGNDTSSYSHWRCVSLEADRRQRFKHR